MGVLAVVVVVVWVGRELGVVARVVVVGCVVVVLVVVGLLVVVVVGVLVVVVVG